MSFTPVVCVSWQLCQMDNFVVPGEGLLAHVSWTSYRYSSGLVGSSCLRLLLERENRMLRILFKNFWNVKTECFTSFSRTSGTCKPNAARPFCTYVWLYQASYCLGMYPGLLTDIGVVWDVLVGSTVWLLSEKSSRCRISKILASCPWLVFLHLPSGGTIRSVAPPIWGSTRLIGKISRIFLWKWWIWYGFDCESCVDFVLLLHSPHFLHELAFIDNLLRCLVSVGWNNGLIN